MPDPATVARPRAFAKLAALWQQHQDGYGRLVARGDIANLYQAGHGLLKIARDPADNDLMRAETVALAALRSQVERALQAYFPRAGPGPAAARSELGRRAPGQRGRPAGRVPQRWPRCAPRSRWALIPDAAWMWRRLLVAIGAAHRAGLIHGAVLPEHVMIHAREHGLVLVDWCLFLPAPHGQVRALVKRYLPWYPPEVLSDPGRS